MFSTVCEGLRYTLVCIINKGSVSLVDTIVDTGAFWTCYKADQIGGGLTEAQFSEKETKVIGGFVNGKQSKNAVRFYRYDVDQFTIGTVDLGSQTVWVTFDERINDNVLGMDILRKVTYLQLEDTGTLYFFKDKDEMKSFVDRH